MRGINHRFTTTTRPGTYHHLRGSMKSGVTIIKDKPGQYRVMNGSHTEASFSSLRNAKEWVKTHHAH